MSVLVTAHNYGRFLPEALDSVLAQDYEGEIECVVVDDGSTDETPQVLRAYSDRIRWVRQDCAGQAAALNTAYALSSGEFFCLLDADDAWLPGKIRAVVAAFASDLTVGVVHHALRLVDSEGRPHPEFRRGFREADGDLSRVMRTTVLRWMFSPTSGLSFRRDVVRHVFPLRTVLRSSADELLAPVAALFAAVRYLGEELGIYRIHGSNVWARATSEPETQEGRVTRARWYAGLLDEKVAQANAAARRAGVPWRFSPWVKWNYVKSVAEAEGRMALGYVPRVLAESRAVVGLSAAERIRLASRILRGGVRQVKRAIRSRWRES